LLAVLIELATEATATKASEPNANPPPEAVGRFRHGHLKFAQQIRAKLRLSKSAPQLRAKSILSDIKSEQSARVVRPFLYPAPVRGLPTCIAAVIAGRGQCWKE